jgi:cytochrome P450 family 710 subfamily A protein
VGYLQGFTNAAAFDPDRFSPERQEDVKFQRNFLTFGTGPHYCVGREYAVNHLAVFLAILSTRYLP